MLQEAATSLLSQQLWNFESDVLDRDTQTLSFLGSHLLHPCWSYCCCLSSEGSCHTRTTTGFNNAPGTVSSLPACTDSPGYFPRGSTKNRSRFLAKIVYSSSLQIYQRAVAQNSKSYRGVKQYFSLQQLQTLMRNIAVPTSSTFWIHEFVHLIALKCQQAIPSYCISTGEIGKPVSEQSTNILVLDSIVSQLYQQRFCFVFKSITTKPLPNGNSHPLA